jgi:glycine/D-amino acid oxidase-like deaminating enzyme
MQRSERELYDTGHVDVSRSAWPVGAPELVPPRLEGEKVADVAVIGAGLAGSSLALHLAERGVDVALVEAREPAWGASGRNAGHVVPYRELDRAYRSLPDRGEAYLALMRDGGDIVYQLAEKHGIDCDAVQGGYLQVAHRPSRVSSAESKAKKWAKRGFAVRFADRDQVVERTGSERFHGGIVAEAGGRVNPYRFTRGLVAAALRAGANAFANSPAESIASEGLRWCVATPLGSVLADRVVVCTNGYTTQLVPELARAWCPLVAFGVALKPLPDSIRAAVIPSGAAISQFPTGTHPTLVDERGRIVSSLLPSPIRPQSPGPPLRWLKRWLHQTFPQTQGVALEVEAHWTGSMAWSTDRLPRIFEVGPGLHALTCFSGEGVVPAPLLGRHLAEAIADDDLKGLALPLQPPSVPRWRGRYDFILRKLAVPALVLAERLGLD